MTREQQCIEEEMKYREWREAPIWYCVKTMLNNITGEMKSEIFRDKDNIPLIIRSLEKPLDIVYENTTTTTYYTYHATYEEGEKQVALASKHIGK